jgi:DNA-binding NarL/FixJ family response regulator
MREPDFCQIPLPVRIYLADEHTAVRQLLSDHLSRDLRYCVVGETDLGDTMVEDCRNLRPQVLVFDLELLEHNGLGLIEEVRREVPEMAIIAFSSCCTPFVVRKLLEAGVLGIVEKRASLQMLEQAILTTAGGRALFSEGVAQLVTLLFSHPSDQRLPSVTPRELEVLHLIVRGMSTKEIAMRLGLSTRTAENHRHRLMIKLRARNAADVMRLAMQYGFVTKTPPSPAFSYERKETGIPFSRKVGA